MNSCTSTDGLACNRQACFNTTYQCVPLFVSPTESSHLTTQNIMEPCGSINGLSCNENTCWNSTYQCLKSNIMECGSTDGLACNEKMCWNSTYQCVPLFVSPTESSHLTTQNIMEPCGSINGLSCNENTCWNSTYQCLKSNITECGSTDGLACNEKMCWNSTYQCLSPTKIFAAASDSPNIATPDLLPWVLATVFILLLLLALALIKLSWTRRRRMELELATLVSFQPCPREPRVDALVHSVPTAMSSGPLWISWKWFNE